MSSVSPNSVDWKKTLSHKDLTYQPHVTRMLCVCVLMLGAIPVFLVICGI